MGTDAECYEKAKAKGERTFTLRAQDMTSPAVICEWIKLNVECTPAKKLHEALDAAIAMTQHTERKLAD
jgi:hypothetical protein